MGIMSDSHDRLAAVDAAVQFFNGRPVDLVLHAGDHVAPFAVRRYESLKADWRGVFGNNDGEREGLEKASLGRIQSDHLVLEPGGLRILLVHRMEDAGPILQEDPSVRVVVFGHSHSAGVEERDDGRLWVNPGELCGYLTGRSSVALLDTESLDVELVTLSPGPAR